MGIGFADRFDSESIGQTQLPGQIYSQGGIVIKLKIGFLSQVCGFQQLNLVIEKHAFTEVFAHGQGQIVQKYGRAKLHNVAVQISHIVKRSTVLIAGAVLKKEVLHEAGGDGKAVQSQGSLDKILHRAKELREKGDIDIGTYQLQGVIL